MKTIKYLSIFIMLFGLLSINVYSQGHDHAHSKDKKTDKKNEVTVKMDKTEKNPIIRKGIIDLKSIDKNKDGKVYQDQMDWNVISDEAGKCPICKMELKQVTLKKAKENLIKNGFKVK